MFAIFTKLSKTVCLINMHILIYRYARCNCNLWKVFWFYCPFWYFHTLLTTIHVWIIVSSPNFHRLFVSWMYTFWYVNMSNVTIGYGRLSSLIAFFFWEFSYITTCLKRYIFIKTSQIMCLGRSVKIKSKSL